MSGCRGGAVSRSRGEAVWRSRDMRGGVDIPKNRKQLRRLFPETSKTPILVGVKIDNPLVLSSSMD